MSKMEWYRLLPPGLLKAAYKAGNGELAWSKKAALQVADILGANGYLISGVDIWIPTRPGPTIPNPIVYDWGYKSLPRKDSYPDTAKKFIENFVWDSNDKNHAGLNPVFNIWAKQKNNQ